MRSNNFPKSLLYIYDYKDYNNKVLKESKINSKRKLFTSEPTDSKVFSI